MKKLCVIFTLVLSIVGFSLIAEAQTIATKPFVELMGTYNEITGTTICSGGYWDDNAFTIALPFTFTYDNTPYGVAYVTTNGYMTFNTSYPYAYYMPPLRSQNYGLYLDLLCPWGDDLHGNYVGTMSYEVTGAAPNRVVTFQWKNWMTYYNRGDALNFQVKLYETSNMIEFVYGTTNRGATTATDYVNVGIAGKTPGDIQNRVGPWVGTTASTNGGITKTYNSANLPPSGLTYRFGCYVPGGSTSVEMVDAQGNPAGYFNSPGTAYAKYEINYPADQAYNVTVTLNFFRIGDNSGQPAYTETFVVAKPLGPYTGIHAMNLNLPPAYYLVEATFSMWNNCLMYEDVVEETSTLFIAPGTVLCEVWPGDVNNDDVVNYGDRKDLNRYIFDANLSSMWLNGPARFKIEAQTNPLAYFKWEGQPSIPWNTPEGCYMDADGNGVVNNFDYVVIKINWARSHGIIAPKSGVNFTAMSFDMDQNFPNPFNPTTEIQHSAPERSQVTLTVTDMLGRTVATLVNGAIDAGVHSATFDASGLTSGNYVATISMAGLETGLTFTKTIKMVLNK